MVYCKIFCLCYVSLSLVFHNHILKDHCKKCISAETLITKIVYRSGCSPNIQFIQSTSALKQIFSSLHKSLIKVLTSLFDLINLNTDMTLQFFQLQKKRENTCGNSNFKSCWLEIKFNHMILKICKYIGKVEAGSKSSY